jgi:hypothetical protein
LSTTSYINNCVAWLLSSSSPFLPAFPKSQPTLPKSIHSSIPVTMADEATKAKIRAAFPQLSPEDFAEVKGDKEKLVKKVVEKAGISEDEAKKQVDAAFS